MNALYQRAPPVALERFQRDPLLLRTRRQAIVDGGQALSAIDFGLADAQHVEVRTV
jgi:hypothetical protein